MAARVVGVALEAALRALLHMLAKLGCATGGDGLQDPLLAREDRMALPIAVAIEPDDVSPFPAGWALHRRDPLDHNGARRSWAYSAAQG
jgi:hypothetical protein